MKLTPLSFVNIYNSTINPFYNICRLKEIYEGATVLFQLNDLPTELGDYWNHSIVRLKVETIPENKQLLAIFYFSLIVNHLDQTVQFFVGNEMRNEVIIPKEDVWVKKGYGILINGDVESSFEIFFRPKFHAIPILFYRVDWMVI